MFTRCILSVLLTVWGMFHVSELNGDEGKHLFILSGQSNMAGLRPDESFTPAVEAAFGKDNVVIVFSAQGGQPIRRWYKKWTKPVPQPKPKTQNKNRASDAPKKKTKKGEGQRTRPQFGDLYDRMLAKVKPACDQQGIQSVREFKSVTFLWMQGERDAREQNGDVYRESLIGIHKQLSKDLDRDDINFVIGRLSDFDNKNARYKHWTQIRKVQVEVGTQYPRSRWVDTDDLNDGLNRRGKKVSNDLHYSKEGYVEFGRRLARQAISLIEHDGEVDPTTVSLKSLETIASKPDEVVVYKIVGDVQLKLHQFNPVVIRQGENQIEKRPAIVFFFGGGWKGGTAKQFYKQARYLANRGMIAFCAEYRTESKHKTSPAECVADGKSAIRFLRGNANRLGVDPDRIVAAGGSAGGQVAAAVATVDGFVSNDKAAEGNKRDAVSCRPNALVLFNPVYDNGPQGYGHSRVQDYWKSFSPLHNIRAEMAPAIVFLGTKDRLIPVATAEKFQKKMQDLNIRSELFLYGDATHGFFNRGIYFVDTLQKTDRFLNSLGYLQGSPTIRLRNE